MSKIIDGKGPDLWNLSVYFFNSTGTVLNFIGEAAAKLAYRKMAQAKQDKIDVEIADHFDSVLSVDTSQVAWFGVAHPEKIMEKATLEEFLKQQAQVRLRAKIQADPTMRFLAANQSLPAHNQS